MINITMGDINFPSNKPNFIHAKLRGVRSLDLNKPSNKKTKPKINKYIFADSPLIIGSNAIAVKNIKKTMPKLLLEFFDNLCSFILLNLKLKYIKYTKELIKIFFHNGSSAF